MKKLNSCWGILACMLILTMLSGCVTDHQVIEKTNYVYIPIGKTLTSPIIPPPPPHGDEYVSASFEQRNVILNDYIHDLYGTIKKLNDRFANIEKLDAKNAAVFDEQNKQETDRVNKLVSDTVKNIKHQE